MSGKITSALQILYGEDVLHSSALVKSLQPDILKTAFRQRALELHPDRAIIHGRSVDEMSEEFKNVHLAYELLRDLPVRPMQETAFTSDLSSPTGRPQPTESNEHYWEADVPQTPMLFGQFLYYAGLITLDTLESAIRWQRRQRPSFGKIARMWNYMSEMEIRDTIASKGECEKIGESALRSGHMTLFQRNTILGFQRYLQRPIGLFFQEIGILKEGEITYLVHLMKKHNARVARMKTF